MLRLNFIPPMIIYIIFRDLFLRPETTNKLIEQSSNIENEVEEATTYVTLQL